MLDGVQLGGSPLESPSSRRPGLAWGTSAAPRGYSKESRVHVMGPEGYEFPATDPTTSRIPGLSEASSGTSLHASASPPL